MKKICTFILITIFSVLFVNNLTKVKAESGYHVDLFRHTEYISDSNDWFLDNDFVDFDQNKIINIDYNHPYKGFIPDTEYFINELKKDINKYNEVTYSIKINDPMSYYYFLYDKKIKEGFYFRISPEYFNPVNHFEYSTEEYFDMVNKNRQIKINTSLPYASTDMEMFTQILFAEYPMFYNDFFNPIVEEYEFSFTTFEHNLEYVTTYYRFKQKDISRDLPLTDKSTIGSVQFDYKGRDLTASIFYNKEVYYIKRSFTSETDMSMFDSIEAYYMNVDNQPQIIINHSDRPYLKDILQAPDEAKPAFVPHTIWDLNTNNLKTILEYKTYFYLKQNDRGVMMAYMYIDEFIIDKLLTIDLSWTSRDKKTGIAGWFGSEAKWERKHESLASDEHFKYRDLTKDWQMLIPVWNIFRSIKKLSTNYTMPQIDSVNFSNTQQEYNVKKSEIEQYFIGIDDDFIGLKNDSRYKVWALTLEQGKNWFGSKTELYNNKDNPKDPNNLNVIEMTYETNGKLYEAVGSDMDIRVDIYEKDDGLLNQDDSISKWILIGVVILIIVAAVNSKAFKNPKAAISFILGVIIIIAAIIIGFILLDKFQLLNIILRL